jgi:Ser/Thr protein kinase RdoA (MazF antagonist)
VTDFPRVRRLDPAETLRELAAVTGLQLALDGPCPGGEVGAAYVRWPRGHQSVLTTMPPGSLGEARRIESLTTAARAAGVPAPRYELLQELPSCVAVVQELMPGSAPDPAGPRTVESMVELNGRCRGLLSGQPGPGAPLYLRTDGPGFCLHGPLSGYSAATAQLLAEVELIGVMAPVRLPGDDLVHFDYHPGNVLADAAGTVTGVVDWDGAGRGNGYLDLVTLCFDLARTAPELGRWLGGQLRGAVAEELALACWAHLSLRLVDWSIRHKTASHVENWLGIARQLHP